MKRLILSGLVVLGTAVPALAAEPTYQFYAGVSQTFLANGQEVGRADVLIERIVDPDRSLIVERVLSPDREHPGKYTEFVVDMRVDVAAGTLSMADRGKAFEGKGTLSGTTWDWNRWTTTSLLPGGMRVESADELLPDGLHASKQVFRPDGKLAVRLNEWFSPITAAEFEDRYYRLVLH